METSMKLTKETLKRIIKEELNAVLNESDENVAKIIEYMKTGTEGFRSALQLADTMNLTQQALEGLMNELNPEKIANDYKDSVWSWPESIDEYAYELPASEHPFIDSDINTNTRIYHVKKSSEIYEYLLEEAQDGLLVELSEMMNGGDTREIASALESVGFLDMMTNKFMDLMLQENEMVKTTPEKIVILSSPLASDRDWETN